MPTKAQLQEQLKTERNMLKGFMSANDKLKIELKNIKQENIELKAIQHDNRLLEDANSELEAKYEGLERAFRIVVGKE